MARREDRWERQICYRSVGKPIQYRCTFASHMNFLHIALLPHSAQESLPQASEPCNAAQTAERPLFCTDRQQTGYTAAETPWRA